MSPNIILIDAEHLDAMTFEMIVNFERMLGRRIPTADLPNYSSGNPPIFDRHQK